MSGLKRRNRRLAAAVIGAAFMMVGLAYASVPLYKLFCQVTGFGGTTQVAQQAPGKSSDRIITVRLNAGIAADLPWEFTPEQREVTVNPGQKALVAYHAESLAGAPTVGTAVYNVSPPKAGKYFHKIECFCFGEQVLDAGQDASMPVLFFVDPAIDEDPGMKDVTVITLSYTFYRAESEALDKALEDFYNQPVPAPPAGAAPQDGES